MLFDFDDSVHSHESGLQEDRQNKQGYDKMFKHKKERANIHFKLINIPDLCALTQPYGQA